MIFKKYEFFYNFVENIKAIINTNSFYLKNFVLAMGYFLFTFYIVCSSICVTKRKIRMYIK